MKAVSLYSRLFILSRSFRFAIACMYKCRSTDSLDVLIRTEPYVIYTSASLLSASSSSLEGVEMIPACFLLSASSTMYLCTLFSTPASLASLSESADAPPDLSLCCFCCLDIASRWPSISCSYPKQLKHNQLKHIHCSPSVLSGLRRAAAG